MLTSNSNLAQTQYLPSLNGLYNLVIQADGNLVSYRTRDFVPANAVWASGTNGKGLAPFRLAMQSDGNLVIYDSTNKATWATNTNGVGTAPFCLIMQDDRNLVVYDSTGTPTWSTHTNI